MNYRKIGDDILNDWFVFREDTVLAYTYKEDRKHTIEFDEISDLILKSISKQNRKYVQKQLNALDDNLMDYIGYWQEKYYRNGFCDGIELIVGCLDK
jgi:hypothetical protein